MDVPGGEDTGDYVPRSATREVYALVRAIHSNRNYLPKRRFALAAHRTPSEF